MNAHTQQHVYVHQAHTLTRPCTRIIQVAPDSKFVDLGADSLDTVSTHASIVVHG